MVPDAPDTWSMFGDHTHTQVPTGGSQATGEALLAWSRSFSNFAQVAQIHRFFGWSEATLAAPCSWTGITCKQHGLVGLWLRDFGLLGVLAFAYAGSAGAF